jgi:hypothetical protein
MAFTVADLQPLVNDLPLQARELRKPHYLGLTLSRDCTASAVQYSHPQWSDPHLWLLCRLDHLPINGVVDHERDGSLDSRYDP